MASGTDKYRGYTIHWDTVALAGGLWDAEAKIIDSSGFRRVIGEIGCESEAGALSAILRAAAKQIDENDGENERRMDEFAGRAMPLRACPLMSYRGTRNWPPTWSKTSGGSLAGPLETQRGEIGILKQVSLSKIEPYNKCYLLIEFRRMMYVGTLLFDDATFCRQLCEFLQNHIGKSIEEIGDLDLSHLL